MILNHENSTLTVYERELICIIIGSFVFDLSKYEVHNFEESHLGVW